MMNVRIVKQDGFNAVAAIVMIVIVIVISGLIIGRVFETNKATSTRGIEGSAPQQLEQQVDADLNEGYVVIKEWGVRFKPASGLVDSTYGINGDTAIFSTAALEKFGATCGTGSETLRPLGRLSRTAAAQEERMSEGAFVKKLGDYYYRYDTPQVACSDDTAAQSLQTENVGLFKPSIATLEVAR